MDRSLPSGLTDRLFERFTEVLAPRIESGYLKVDRARFAAEARSGFLTINSGVGIESEFEWDGAEETALEAAEFIARRTDQEISWELAQGLNRGAEDRDD